MKKAIVFHLFLFMAIFHPGAFAQSPGLTIKLLDALSFTINQPENLNFELTNNGKMKDKLIAKVPDHITVISSRGYVVKAVSGAAIGKVPKVSLTSYISKTNKGNTDGLFFGRSIQLHQSKGSANTVISASHTSWNGINPENKFDIDYSIESGNLKNKEGIPASIPVIFTVLQP